MSAELSRAKATGNGTGAPPKEALLAMKGSLHGLWYRDLRSERMWFSEQWKHMLGLEHNEIGDDRREFLDRVHPEDLPMLEHEQERHIAGETPIYECEFRMRHKDGTYRWMRSRGTVTRDAEGKPIYIAGSHEEITDHKNLELFYRLVLDAVPGVVWVKNEDLKFEFVNKELAKLYGTTSEDAIGKGDSDFNKNAAQIFGFQCDDRRALKGEVVRRDEILTDATGVDHQMETVKFQMPAAGSFKGKGPLEIGFAIDNSAVVELRLAREQLQHERDALKNLMDNVPDGIFFKDLDSRLVRANRALAQLVGRGFPEELVGMTDLDLFGDPEYANVSRAEEEELFRSGHLVQGIRRTPTKDGVRWRLFTKAPVRNSYGEITGLCGISKDVTELIEAQEKLRQSEEELTEILNHLPQFVFVKDKDLRYLKCNKPFADRHNEPSIESVKGKTDYDYWETRQADEFRKDDAEVLRTNAPKRYREEQVLPNGLIRQLETQKLPLHDEFGNPVKVLGIYEDVTGRIDEAKLRFHKDVARTIGHCLKTRMKVVFDNVEEIRERNPVLEADRAYQRLRRSTEYLLHASELATRIATLDASFTPEDFNVNDVVDAVLATMDDPRIGFIRGGDTWCMGPRTHFENAVLEVLSNARHYAPPFGAGGRIHIRTESLAGMWRVDIEDTGKGVPEAIRKNIFEYFTAGDGSRTGMGLAYAKWVVEACGGSIQLLPPGDPSSRFNGAHFVVEGPSKGAWRR